MNINLVNFARYAPPKELRWMCGTQFPNWIKEMLNKKAAGVDCASLIDALAEVCSVTPETEVLP
jgi:hypothetical protein